MTIGEQTTQFDRPRPTDDPYTADQYAQLGLSEAPSLDDIQPHALRMMENEEIFEAMGLVLGRRIDMQDTLTDTDLRDIALIARDHPKRAFTGLLLILDLEDF